MAQAKIMTKDGLLSAINAQLPELATKKPAKGWDIVLEPWDDETITKAMGRSTKLPGAIWAIEWRLTDLVAMRNEAQQAESEATESEVSADDVIAAEDAAELAEDLAA